MSTGDALIVASSLLVLFFAGRAFLNRSIFRDLEDPDLFSQVRRAFLGRREGNSRSTMLCYQISTWYGKRRCSLVWCFPSP